MIIVDIIFSIGLFISITVMGYKRYKETQDFKDSLSWFLLNMFAGAYLALVHFFTIFNLPLVLDHPFLYSIVILALSMLGVAICYMVRQVTPVILFLLILLYGVICVPFGNADFESDYIKVSLDFVRSDMRHMLIRNPEKLKNQDLENLNNLLVSYGLYFKDGKVEFLSYQEWEAEIKRLENEIKQGKEVAYLAKEQQSTMSYEEVKKDARKILDYKR